MDQVKRCLAEDTLPSYNQRAGYGEQRNAHRQQQGRATEATGVREVVFGATARASRRGCRGCRGRRCGRGRWWCGRGSHALSFLVIELFLELFRL